MVYYPAIKRNENSTFATTWMDLEGIMLSQRKANTIYFTPMWNLRNKTNEQREKKTKTKPENRILTIETKLMINRGEVEEGMSEITGIQNTLIMKNTE